jgi:hypothetical protein
VPQPDELSLGPDARQRLQSLLTAIREAEQDYELMLYIERFFGLQTEIRQYFSLIEHEIIDKLHELRETEQFNLPPTGALEPRRFHVRGDKQ